MVEGIDGVVESGAGGTDRTIELIHGCRDQVGGCEDIVLHIVHLLGQRLIIVEVPVVLEGL